MALKQVRKYDEGTDIVHVLNAATEAGVVVRHVSSASGTGKPGDGNNVVEAPTNASGIPLGILVSDVVSIDLSRYPHTARFHRDEVPVGSPVTVVTHGYVYTNMLASGAVNPAAGAPAYYTTSGLLTDTNTGSVMVGRFRGNQDADGYVGVDVNVRV